MSQNEGSKPRAGTPEQSVRRLVRRSEGKVVAGVANGLGDYFGVDPVWFRLGFAAAAFLGGAGVVAYLVLWAVMPEGTADSPAQALIERHADSIKSSVRSVPSWVGVGLLAIGGLLLVMQIVDWRPGVFWGTALIVLGVLLFRQPHAFGSRATLEAGTLAVPPIPPPGDTPPPLPSPAPSSPATKRERSYLGWMTLGGVLLALGVAGVLDRADVFEVRLVQYLALALAVLGVGMAAGAWWGRARWLVVPGLLLVPFMLTASLIHVPFTGGAGDKVYRPASAQNLDPEYHLVAGQLLFDLRELDLGGRSVSVEATTVAGRIVVMVPPSMPFEIRARVSAGDVTLFERHFDGLNVDVRRTFTAGTPPGTPVLLSLDLETSLGQVQVIQAEANS